MTAFISFRDILASMEQKKLERWLEPDECMQLLDSTDTFVLTLNGEDGWPYSVPLNFVRVDDCLYYHGGRKGGTVECMKRDDRCTVTVFSEGGYEDYGGNSCDTTTLFGSVVVRGRMSPVEDDEQKRIVLEALVAKLTPGKSSCPMNMDTVSRTGVYRITMDEVTGKRRIPRQGSRTIPIEGKSA